jgi:ELWxxDGT repeat protein
MTGRPFRRQPKPPKSEGAQTVARHRSRNRRRLESVARSRRLTLEQFEPRQLLAAQLLADINTTPGGVASDGPFVDLNGVAYFAGRSDDGEFALWKSDGTTAGTTLVKDVEIKRSFYKYDMVNASGTLFFRGYDDANGEELWKSDGTTAGTMLVKDLVPGAKSPYIKNLTSVNGRLLFSGEVTTNFSYNLLTSDGTAAGTTPIDAGTLFSPETFVVIGNTAFFSASGTGVGTELWKSDGTEAGTALVSDILPGTGSSSPKNLVNVNGTLFFTANTGSGYQLWKSDGTAAGTVLIGSVPQAQRLVNVNGTIFFSANDGTHGYELWKSDGTAAGTMLVKDIWPGSSASFPLKLTSANGLLFFVASDGTHFNVLWQSDGTPAGTQMVKPTSLAPNINSTTTTSLATLGNFVYFAASDSVHGTELWKTDGTATGTVLVSEAIDGSDGLGNQDFLDTSTSGVAGGKLFYTVSDSTRPGQLWVSDGTSAGTSRVIRTGGSTAPSSPTLPVVVGSTAYFAANDGAHGTELWKTNGTAAGTMIVKDIVPGPSGSHPVYLMNANGTLFFRSYSGGTWSLWKSDGTADGTVWLASPDLPAPRADNATMGRTAATVGGTLFFQANDPVHGYELWKSDGTPQGTGLLKDIAPGLGSSDPYSLLNVNGVLYFIASDGLWRSDGTAAGTVLIKNIANNFNASLPNFLTNVNGKLFFSGDDGQNGPQLWTSDGTPAGTFQVNNNYSFYQFGPHSLANVNGTLFYAKGDAPAIRDLLWKSDGTTAGTGRLSNLNTGPAGPRYLTNVNGTLFFIGNDGTNGYELWKSDGTATGTVMVKDILPGSAGSQSWAYLIDPHYPQIINGNGTLFFKANDGTNGSELWQSSGTSNGTVQVADIAAGGASSAPGNFALLGDVLLFAANDVTHGRELWTTAAPLINAAPSGTNTTVKTLANTDYALAVSDFGFSDPNNSPANQLLAVQIATLPAVGSLSDGAPLTAGQVIPVADIVAGKLIFSPPTGGAGNGLASFTFQVQDDGGTASGGVDLDPTPNTITVNVIPLNHSPSGTSGAVTALDHAAYTFAISDFGFQDSSDSPPNAPLGVKITTLPATGKLTYGGANVVAGQTVTFNGGSLVFTAAATDFNSQAPYTSFTFQLKDDGGTFGGGVDLDPAPKTLTVNLLGTHTAPAGADKTITFLEINGYTFTSADFGFTDPGDSPGDNFAAVKITTLPAKGTLSLGTNAVVAGQLISVADLSTLTYQTGNSGYGPAFASFQFQVQDDGGTLNGGSDFDPTPNTLTFNVTSANHAPFGTNTTVTIPEDSQFTFSIFNFGFIDPLDSPQNNFAAVKITTLPALGTLYFGSSSVSAGQFIPAASISLLRYVPPANGSGFGTVPSGIIETQSQGSHSGGIPFTAFTFQVQDNGGTANGGVDLDPTPNTMTITVIPVNDPPVGADRTLTAPANAPYVFKATDFPLTDPKDIPANNLSAVRIVTLPQVGMLTDAGQPVTAFQIIPVADLSASKLQFTPAANAGGTPYTSFKFQVQDDGGTANFGMDLSFQANTITLNVVPICVPPPGPFDFFSVTTPEDVPYVFRVADFPVLWSDDSLTGLTVVSPPTVGTLTDNGAPVAANQTISLADISQGMLLYTPPPNASPFPAPSITFQTLEGGGVCASQINSLTTTAEVSVASVNDPPSGNDKTVTTQEDAPYTFAVADFSFSDTNDSPPNMLLAVKISSLPASGVLTGKNGAPVSVNDLIAASDLNSLVFTPATNANDGNIAKPTFTFQIQDNGGTISGGIDLDPTPNTITISVTPVNDGPSGQDKTVIVALNDLYGFQFADFGFTDLNDVPANKISGVVITSAPKVGVLVVITDVGSNLGVRSDPTYAFAYSGMFVPAPTGLTSVNFAYQPPANTTGDPVASFTFQVKDNGGTANGGVNLDPVPKTFSFVTPAPPPPPAGSDTTVTSLEDTAYTFQSTDFYQKASANDPQGTNQYNLLAVTFVTLPDHGTLMDGNTPVAASQQIMVADIVTGKLKFMPAANANGSPLVSFTFQVRDDRDITAGVNLDPTPNTITINVTPVNDPPSFVAGPAQNVLDTGGPQLLVGWAKQISPGSPDEAGQKVHFEVNTDNAGLFAALPAVDATGKLTFEPAVGTSGIANVTVVAIDDGGTANGGVDTSPSQTFTIGVSLAQPLHNRAMAPDVTADGNVVAEDALDVINFIHASGSGPVTPANPDDPQPALYYDVTGDNYIAADDVVTIVNYINAHPTAQQEAVPSPPSALISPLADTSGAAEFCVLNGLGYSQSSDPLTGVELKVTDGVTARVVKDIKPGIAGSFSGKPGRMGVANGTLFFSANDGTHGYELWKSDGTTAGTVLLKDLNTATAGGSSDPRDFANVNGTLYFSASDGVHGAQLWKTDGTPDGTTLVKQVNPSQSEFYGPTGLTNVNGTLYFETNGTSLWKSDGTESGTVLLKTIPTRFLGGPQVSDLMNLNGLLVFMANDGTHGYDLWKSDGTAEGTVAIKDVGPPGITAFFPNQFTQVGSKVYYETSDGVHGYGLYVSDGTAAGTNFVAPVGIGDAANLNGTLFFYGLESAHGGELWQSDGTASGTTLVKDLYPGTAGSYPEYLTNLNGTLVFTARQYANSKALWRSDGTAANTVPYWSISGSASSVRPLGVLNGVLLYQYWQGEANPPPSQEMPAALPASSFSVTLWRTDGTYTGTYPIQLIPFPGNHPPSGTDKSVYTSEDSSYTVTATDFGFSDSSDTPPNNFQSVMISTLPAKGALTDGTSSVVAGQFISKADIDAGLLRFTPPPDASGSPYTTFTYQVQDDGGTSSGGSDLDQTPNALTINVSGVNDPPTGADNTLTLLEDQSRTITIADFSFSDSHDSPLNSFLGVKITTIPQGGVLTVANQPVTAGALISAISVVSGVLKYTPAPNGAGSSYDQFTFQVRDDGGNFNGGSDTDPVPKTMTLNVTPVNDPPAGHDGAISTPSSFPYLFKLSDYGFSDPQDSPPNNFRGVVITTLPDQGYLTVNLQPAVAGQFVDKNDYLEFHADSYSSASFTFQVKDDGGTANGGSDLDPAPNTMFMSNACENSSLGEHTIHVLEDQLYVFSLADFGISNTGGVDDSIMLLSTPPSAVVRDGNTPLSTFQLFSIADIAAGLVSLVPSPNANGDLGTFRFVIPDGVADGIGICYGEKGQITINASAVNDPPDGSNNTVTTKEDTPYSFSAADFGFSDPNDNPSNALFAVKISSLPASGALTAGNGVPVQANDVIAASDLGGLVFTPAINSNDGNASRPTFTFQIKDNGGTLNFGLDLDPTPNTLTISVASVNDAPMGTGKTVSVAENKQYVFGANDFGASDPNDSPPNNLLAVSIDSLPDEGVLLLNDIPVFAGQKIQVVDLAAGALVFVFGVNPSRDTSFTFQVQDDGGTANGGGDQDLSPKTIALARGIKPVCKLPGPVLDETVTVPVNGFYTIPLDFFIRSESITVIGVQGSGVFSDNGVPLTLGQIVPAADITAGQLIYRPPSNANGAALGAVAFLAQGDAGICRIVEQQTLTVNVAPVNDPPGFTKGSDQIVTDKSGPQAVGAWATKISAGPPDEVVQKVHFQVTSDNSSLFSAQPAIDATGKLTFQPALGANGIANVTVVAVDDGGTANGGDDTSPPQMFTIGVSLAEPLHNRENAADVTGDGHVVAEDALDVINFIHASGSGPVTPSKPGDPPATLYYDVTGDDYIAADDVVTIVNYINAHPTPQQEARQPEALQPELAVLSSPDTANDALLLLLAADIASQPKRSR